MKVLHSLEVCDVTSAKIATNYKIRTFRVAMSNVSGR